MTTLRHRPAARRHASGSSPSAGEVVDGPRLQIGNTTSLVDFGCDPGDWVDTWSATGISHHWALGVGDLRPELRATADLLGVELVEVAP